MNKQLSADNTLGIYIHIPFCQRKCTYCDFPSYGNLQAYYESYVAALVREIEQVASMDPALSQRPLASVYIGGGTPTELPAEDLVRILEAVRRHFYWQEGLELTIEANPGSITRSDMETLVTAGMTRLSLGVQSIHNHLLATIGRIHTIEDVEAVLADTVAAKVPAVSVDFIYGLPGQTLADIREMCERLQTWPIQHISVYSLQLEETTRLYTQVKNGEIALPEEEIVDAMYDTIMQALPAAGWERYEISNFAKDGAYSYHNLRYWQYGDYIGLGAGAHSFCGNQRWANHPHVVPYIQQLEAGKLPRLAPEIIGQDRAMEDFCFLALRTKFGIREDAFAARFGDSLAAVFGNVLEDLVERELLTYHEDAYVLTPAGAKHGNYVFAQFIRG